MFKSALDHLSWIDGAGGEAPLKQSLYLNNLVAAIQEDYLENLLLQVPQRVDKVLVNLLGR